MEDLDKKKRALYSELKTTMGYIRAADQLMGGLGKKPKRNKSAEKRERLQKRLDREAEEEMKARGE